MPRMTGAKYLAETLKAYGVSHVFLVPAVLRKSLAEMDMVGIKRSLYGPIRRCSQLSGWTSRRFLRAVSSIGFNRAQVQPPASP